MYHVLFEPWVRVVTLDGEHVRRSVFDVLSHAYKYKSFDYFRPMEEFSVFLFHELLLIDAYVTQRHFHTEREWNGLRSSFDENVLSEYILWCEEHGMSWDLFDETRPFLQIWGDVGSSDGISTIAEIDCALPKGNNRLYVDGCRVCEKSVDDLMCGLLTSIRYSSPAAGRGWKCNINGGDFLHIRLFGENLQELLFRNLLRRPRGLCDVNDGYGIPVWRDMFRVKDGHVTAEDVGWLDGCLFPRKCVRFILDGNVVRQVYLAHGFMTDVKDLSWYDPYSLHYVVSKKKSDSSDDIGASSESLFRTFTCAKPLDLPCYTIGLLCDFMKQIQGSHQDRFYSVLFNKPFSFNDSTSELNNALSVDVFTTKTNQGTWEYDHKDTQFMPLSLFVDSDDINLIGVVATRMLNDVKEMSSKVLKVFLQKSFKNNGKDHINQIVYDFEFGFRQIFQDELVRIVSVPGLMNNGEYTDVADVVFSQWMYLLKREIMRSFENGVLLLSHGKLEDVVRVERARLEMMRVLQVKKDGS